MTLPTISSSTAIAPNLSASSSQKSEKNLLQQAIDGKNTATIITALEQTKAGDFGVIASITNTLTTKDNGLDLKAKRALCNYLSLNGFDLHEPIREGKTVAEIANDHQDHELATILDEASSTPNPAPAPAFANQIKTVVHGITAASVASLFVSPFIRIIDKSVTDKQAGKISSYSEGLINETVELCKRPGPFFRSPYYLSMLGVYGSTYITANVTEAVCLNHGQDPLWYKLGFSSIVNIVTSNLRDGLYAQLSGKGPARPMPFSGRLLFGVRDSSSIAAGFIMPKYAAEICKQYGMSEKQAGYVSQLGTPVLLQFFIAPMHLLALDLYNHPNSTLKNVYTRIKHEYPQAIGPRMLRSLIAYGGGGLTNTWLKERLSSSESRKL